MKHEHIVSTLESAPLPSLSENDLARIRAHVKQCSECRGAYEAAQIASALLVERTSKEFEPPPFFQTRVLAALRERQAANQISPLRRLWNATNALVYSMSATVAVLAVLTFYSPTSQPVSQPGDVTQASNRYSVEEVLLNQNESTDDEMTYGQVLATLYETDDDR